MQKNTPRRGDFISYFFEDQLGHEQAGRRPALVVSNSDFNSLTGIIFVCPVTKTNRNYPFHVEIPEGGKVFGVVMTDQLKAIDFNFRKPNFLETAPPHLTEKVVALIDRIIR